MSLLTDKDINKLRDKDIVIDPFYNDGLTPVGYDFHVGEFVYSLDQAKLLKPVDGYYSLPPENTILILTSESLWVSKRIGGLFHSKVSLVSKGLSPISTTLDPNWYGPLLITLRNNNKVPFLLPEKSAFVTLVMFKVSTPTESKHNKPERRIDVLMDIIKRAPANQAEKLLEDQIREYIDKVSPAFDPGAQKHFKELVEKATKPLSSKIAEMAETVTITNFRRRVRRNVETVIAYFLIVLLSSLQFFWNQINFLFGGIPYDSAIFAGQMLGVLAVVVFILERRPRQA